GRHHPEHSAESLLRDTSLAAALWTGDRAAPGLCARALAHLTVILLLKLDRLLHARRNFVQRQLHLRLEVVATASPLRGARPTAATHPTKATSHAAAEDLVEHREDVGDVHVRKIVLAADALVAELVVACAAGCVGEHLVCFRAFLEFQLRVGLVRAVV